MKEILIMIGISASPVLLGLVAYFLKELIHNNSVQHKKFEENIAEIEHTTFERFAEISREVRTDLREQSKKILEVKEAVTIFDAKQERLDIFARQIDEIHKAVDKKTKIDEELEEKIIEQQKEVEEIKNSLQVEIPETDYRHFFNSAYLSEVEKNAIREHIELLKHAPLQSYKITPFIKFIEIKIEKKRLSMINIHDNWRVSASLMEETKTKK